MLQSIKTGGLREDPMSNASPRWHNLFPDLDFDPDALRERYRQERDKRLRDDGENQYLEAAENFAHYADEDPYTAQTPREAIKRDVNVVVVGAASAASWPRPG